VSRHVAADDVARGQPAAGELRGTTLEGTDLTGRDPQEVSMQRTRFDRAEIGAVLYHGTPTRVGEQGEQDSAGDPPCRTDE